MPYDAIVIGTGFGGTIAAVQLAAAGKSVLLLERGTFWRSPAPLSLKAENGRATGVVRAAPGEQPMTAQPAATRTGRGGICSADGLGAELRAAVWLEFDSSTLLQLEQ